MYSSASWRRYGEAVRGEQEKVSALLDQGYDFPYLGLDFMYSILDGKFTSSQLRAVADAMDRLEEYYPTREDIAPTS